MLTRRGISLLVLPTFVACAAQSLWKPVALPELPRVTEVFAPPPGAGALAFNAARYFGYHVVVGDIEYVVSVLSENMRVSNISTRDKHFATPEGMRVGMTWAEVKAAVVTQESLTSTCNARLSSGWVASFMIDQGLTCDTMSDETLVDQFDLNT